ncbi:MAG: hypothetical protein ILO68_03055, partial [Clostridia bacterium]|nr:hypothetical protein [Clostridia bacterium]
MSKKQNESSFEFEKELKNAMDGVEMPEDSRRRVRDGVKAASREEHAETVFGKKPFPVRRVVLIAAAVLLVAALTAGLVVWMRPSAPQDPATVPEGSGESSLPDARPIVSSAEGDWVTDLFKEEALKENGSGTIADSDASYLPSGAWKTEEGTAEDKPSSSA